MTGNPFDDFALETLQECSRRGMQFPLTLRAICSNGTVLEVRYDLNDNEVSRTVIEQNIVPGGDELPVYGVIRDDLGQSACFSIEHDGPIFH